LTFLFNFVATAATFTAPAVDYFMVTNIFKIEKMTLWFSRDGRRLLKYIYFEKREIGFNVFSKP
jgi:hypothetical protein